MATRSGRSGASTCREGSWGWQVVDELAPREDEAIVRKPRYDAFYGTQLEHMLRCGASTP